MKLLLAVVAMTTTLGCGVALAQTAAERAACQADFEKFCPGVEPGGGRGEECLAKDLDKLTPECKKVVEGHMPK
jgi:hypothetical protein